MTIFSKPLMRSAFNSMKREKLALGRRAAVGGAIGAAYGAGDENTSVIGGAMAGAGLVAGGRALGGIAGRNMMAGQLRSYRGMPGGRNLAKAYQSSMKGAKQQAKGW